MHYLTSEQIDFVASEVSNAEITFSHLKDDLIDHLCCEIETEIRRGSSFDDAFNQIKQKVGVKSLKKVQENTLLLIDKKYRFMKNTMKISGIVSIGMIAFGALFKLMHWPGAGLLIVFGFLFLLTIFLPTALWIMKKESKLKSPILLYVFGFLGVSFMMIGFLFKIQHWPGAGYLFAIGYIAFCVLFMPILLYFLLKNTTKKSLHIAYILGFLAFTCSLVGQFFKIMHWPGAAVLLVFGSVLLVAIFLPYYAYVKYKDSKSVQGSFLFLCVGILFFTIFNNLYSMNASGDVVKHLIEPIKKIDEITLLLKNNNLSIYQYFTNDSLAENAELNKNLLSVKNESDKLCVLIYYIKLEIVSQTDNIDKKSAEKVLKDPFLLKFKEDWDSQMKILYGGSVELLKNEMNAYKNVLLKYTQNNSRKTLIENIFNTNDRVFLYSGDYKWKWEVYLFDRMPAINTLNILSGIEMNVRLAESEVINELINSRKSKVLVLN